MNKLPSIISTYHDTFKLFAKVFIPVLPFTLLLVIAEHFYNDYQQQFLSGIQSGQEINYSLMFAVYVSYYIIYTLLFSIALYGIAQYKKTNSYDYPQALEKGAARTPALLLSVIILVGPLILLMLGLFLAINPVMEGILALLLTVVCIGFLIIFIYCYVASALIVVRGHSAINGLSHSLKMTKGHWWKTFVLLVIMIILTVLIVLGLQQVTPEYADEIIMIFIFPLSCTLMLTHMENLEKAYESPTTTAVVTDKKET